MSEEGQKTEFDPVKLKAEIVTDTTSYIQDLIAKQTSVIAEEVEKRLKPVVEPAKKPKYNIDADLIDEVEKLGLDEEQALAFERSIEKKLQKLAPKIQGDTEDKINGSLQFKEQKMVHDTKAKEQFPDMADQNSPLFKQAVKIFQSIPEEERKRNPKATYNAVLEAAAELGIKPLTLAELRAREAAEVRGSGPSKTSTKISETDYEVAAAFGISKEDFERNLAKARAKRK